MTTVHRSLLLLLLALPLACAHDKGTGVTRVTGEIHLDMRTPGVNLAVYSDGRGTLLKTVQVPEAGATLVTVAEENPYYRPPRYYFYATRPGFYTALTCCTSGESEVIELAAVVPDRFCGILVLDNDDFADVLAVSRDFTLRKTGTGDPPMSLRTDAEGRFALDVAEGEYIVQSDSYGGVLQVSGSYGDCRLTPTIPRKPNIYLRPAKPMRLDVRLHFPQGGSVLASIPEYGNGWTVDVDPSGRIGDRYDYLFYESTNPDLCQYRCGWVVAREDLSSFFRGNLALAGFRPDEVDDFVEYWIPRLTDRPFYAIFPQFGPDVDRMVRLEISETPDAVLRLFYSVVARSETGKELPVPVVPRVDRHGFSVAEWGVILR